MFSHIITFFFFWPFGKVREPVFKTRVYLLHTKYTQMLQKVALETTRWKNVLFKSAWLGRWQFVGVSHLVPRSPGPRHVRGASAPAHPPQRGTEPRTVLAPRQCRRPAAPRPAAGPTATEPGREHPTTYPAGSRAPRNSGEAARARRLRGHDGDPGKHPARQGPRSAGLGGEPPRPFVRPCARRVRPEYAPDASKSRLGAVPTGWMTNGRCRGLCRPRQPRGWLRRGGRAQAEPGSRNGASARRALGPLAGASRGRRRPRWGARGSAAWAEEEDRRPDAWPIESSAWAKPRSPRCREGAGRPEPARSPARSRGLFTEVTTRMNRPEPNRNRETRQMLGEPCNEPNSLTS